MRTIRLSLRSLLLLVAIAAVAITSFRRASDGWRSAIVGIAFLMFCWAVSLAGAARGPRRAAAIGCAAAMAAYGLALFLSAPLGSPIAENREFNPSTGRLPTSRILNQLYSHVAELSWVDIRTGKPTDEPPPSASLNAGDSVTTTTGEIPDRETFMVIGHAWCALLLGCAGGWLTRQVYLRRIRANEC